MGLGVICIFFTAKELFPGRMNPNSLFSEVFECIRYNEEVTYSTYLRACIGGGSCSCYCS